ncbi:hypothetical protein GCM10010177_46950 [Actinomadura citrea]|nr:hypothetical protein GCM10010177_46950 [Actinomadura citrea]
MKEPKSTTRSAALAPAPETSAEETAGACAPFGGLCGAVMPATMTAIVAIE